MRHASQLRWGTKTLLDGLTERVSDSGEVLLWGRQEIEAVAKETFGEGYNAEVKGTALFVNTRAKPNRMLVSLCSRKSPFAALAGGSLLAARLKAEDVPPGEINARAGATLSKKLERLEAPSDSLFSGYWDLVASNGLAIAEQARRFEDPPSLGPVEVRGPRPNLRVEGGAEVEAHVTFDVRLGPVVIERGAYIESFSRLMGPCYIGPKTKLYSALIGGGTSIFDGCKVGGQVENSVIMPHTNKAHHGYVGDSYLGEWVNLGAGSTFSNLKNTYGNVRVDLGRGRQDTGLLKLGPIVGDMAKVSIGALVYSGRAVWTASHISGLASRNVPSFTFLDGTSGKMIELKIESVVETQRRMMERRGLDLSRAQDDLIRKLFASTAGDRRKAGVRKGNIS